MTRPPPPIDYPPDAFDDPSTVPPPLPDAILADLVARGLDVDVDVDVRAEAARDWWPLSLADTAAGRVAHWPGAVVRARDASDVVAVLDVARRHRVPVTAQGGRSGVEGGAVAPDGAIALDLTGLDRVLDVDPIAGQVSVQAGVFGPDLETALAAQGLTLGHRPQSFDLSTVGGWLATRGAGQYSNRYGTIAEMVREVDVVLASGELVRLGSRAPRRAVGPELVSLFVGSEGALGVITRATLAVRRAPASEVRGAWAFTTFDGGLEACRRILQRGAAPAVARLYDEAESRRHFQRDDCVLVVLDEGDEHLTAATRRVVAEECSDAVFLGEEPVAAWLERRNDVSELAPLWAQGVVVDTIEVAGPWGTLAATRAAMLTALRTLPDTVSASCHQSHAYPDGACLYVTFAGVPGGDPAPYYRAAWDAATAAALDHDAALSHHHGIGRNRSRFLARALGSQFDLLAALKGVLDPDGILNPGVLALAGAPW
ncbi:MAG: FAD-binding oxidoreductase [Acidimicrobiales bacterium]